MKKELLLKFWVLKFIIMLNKQCIYIENKNNIFTSINYASNSFVDYYDYENVSRETFIRQILSCRAVLNQLS